MISDIQKEEIRKLILGSGAVATGFAEATPVDARAAYEYDKWIGEGHHASMGYLERHAPLRKDPSNVLEKVRTVISTAFSYEPQEPSVATAPAIACYAWGDDYHDVIRRRLAPVVDRLKTEYGHDWRICIDSAPIPERYWAMKAGIGRRGINGSVGVDGYGCNIFLAEILTSLPVAPDAPTEAFCHNCGACVKACPTGALLGDGTVNCRRCINYLTIEHRGEWDAEGKVAMATPQGRRSLFGCDICHNVCPLNKGARPTLIEEFFPRKEIISLTSGDGARMNQSDFSSRFKGSPIKRAKLEGLLRNALNSLSDQTQ